MLYFRLSKLMGQKLTDANPNIADLSDLNRPTKLAERFIELYDNQWTDAFEEIDNGDENQTIGKLLNILYVSPPLELNIHGNSCRFNIMFNKNNETFLR